ncbi:MAG: cache domain-containing protein [Campylobacterales bacterium]|nr:cache domain-containing protein [Campylobacterales bacterium]
MQVRKEPEFSVRFIENIEGVRVDTWEYKSSEYITTSIETSIAEFDHRERVWYKGANKPFEFFWTDLYKFASTGKIGITIAYPYFNAFNEKVLVSAVDISSEIVSTFLKEQSKLLDGDLIIFDENGEVVGVSFDDINHVNNKISLSDLKSSMYATYFNEIKNDKKI